MERERRRERIGDHVSHKRVEINREPIYLLAVRRRWRMQVFGERRQIRRYRLEIIGVQDRT